MEPPDERRSVERPLDEWLDDRTPGIPPAFRPHLLAPEPSAASGPGTLAEMGAEAIAEALAAPGRNRASAFRLLAGDALLTYACEAAAMEKDPGPGLRDLLAKLGDRFR